MKSKLFAVGLLASLCFGQERKSFSVSVQGAGPALILIPGLECPGAVWKEFGDRYRSHFEVHAITIAGFAGEPAVPGLTLKQVKDDLIDYIRERQLNKPVLIGHSLGGFLAFWIGSSAPDLVGGIVSVDGPPYLPALVSSGAVDAEKMKLLYSSLGPKQLEQMSRMALSQMISDPKQVDVAAHWAGQSDPSFVGQAIYDLMTTDLRPELRNIRAPILMIGAAKAFASGETQLMKVRAAYEDQLKAASDHKLILAERALHFVMLDDPEFLYGATDEFLGVRP